MVHRPKPASAVASLRRQGTVGEQVAQPGIQRPDRGQNGHSPVPVLTIGRMDIEPEEMSGGIGDDMTLAALHFLAGIEAARPARLGGLDRLAVDHPGRGGWPRGRRSRATA